MKKLFLSLIIFCCVTVTWAGTGDGTKDNPYMGEWQASELAQTLKVGDYLAYHCVIKNGDINVTDAILNEKIVKYTADWAVGDPIDDTPWNPYLTYCKYNTFEQRQTHTFLVTELKIEDCESGKITIHGYYSGAYNGLTGTEDNPYTGEWQASDLLQMLNRGDYLGYNCVIKYGNITVTDTKLGIEVAKNVTEWAVSDPIDDSPWTPYTNYCTYNDSTVRRGHTFLITDLEFGYYGPDEPNLFIKGYYSGEYDNRNVVATETIKVSSAQQLYDAFFGNLDRRDVVIKLIADIDMKDVAEKWHKQVVDNHPIFQGTIDGYYNVTDNYGNFVLNSDGTIAIGQRALVNHNGVLTYAFKDAVVKGVKLKNWNKDPGVLDVLDSNAELLATIARDSKFQDITLENCSYKVGFWSSLEAYIASGYGLMFSTMRGCTVENVRLVGCSLFQIGAKVGGIAGTAYATTFRHCYTEHFTSIYGEASNAYVGGLVGDATDCTFEDCVNMASVTGSEKSDNIGGLTGICTRCTFRDCVNTGPLAQVSRQSAEDLIILKGNAVLSHLTTMKDIAVSLAEYDMVWKHLQMTNVKVGRLKVQDMDKFVQQKGIDAKAYSKSQMTSCLMTVLSFLWTVYGEVTEMLDPDEMGGMSGAAYGCTFDRCLNTGILHCLDAYCGGIVGFAGMDGDVSTKFNYCVNRGYVQGDEQTGGIVGYLKDGGSLRYCLNTGAVDCVKDTRGSMYGETNLPFAPLHGCFALSHEDTNTTGDVDGLHLVSLQDVKSGRAAYDLNNLSGTRYFRQNVGEHSCPVFQGDVVTLSDINEDVSLTYEVEESADFMLALFDPYADIALKSDIDFGGDYFTVYRETFPFRGTIDGEGHAIKNMKANIDAADEDSNKWHWVAGYTTYFGLLGATDGATFKNLEIKDFDLSFPQRTAFLSSLSKNTTYQNVSITGNSSMKGRRWVGGLVYESHNDTFDGCTIADTCKIGSTEISTFDYDADAGGFASIAYGSKFTDCVNSGEIYARTDGAGGIVADCEHCTFVRCVNNGHIYHSSTILENDDEVGGIAATAENSNFYQCTNSGHLRCNDEYGGGIVGRGVGVSLFNCLNTSQNLEFDSSTCGGIIGEARESLIFNCCSNADYPLIGNISVWGIDENSGNNFRVLENNTKTSKYEKTVTRREMKSGLVAQYLNKDMESAGFPWRQNLSAHDGMTVDECPSLDPTHDLVTAENRASAVAITTSEELMAFAQRVNEGEKDQFASAHLEADIDMDGYDWTPIGNNGSSGQYRGAFDGRGHTIKNLKVNTSAAAGLFGVAHVGAEIRNVIIGEGSEITCTSDEGAAGILGQVKIGWDWGFVNIENCGSYASVYGKNHAGGILGIVLNNTNDNVKVYVNNCFSRGTINAEEGNSGLLCGYTRNSAVIRSCWSDAKLQSSSWTKPFDDTRADNEYFAGYSETIDIQNCYSIDAAGNNVQGLPSFNASQNGVLDLYHANLSDGQLTYRLNGSSNDAANTYVWQQELGVDAQPVWGSKGVFLTRTVSAESNGYGTLCLPYTVKSDDDIRYYSFSEATGNTGDVELNFEYAETVPAGTPVLFRVNTPGAYTIYGADGGVNSWAYLAYSSGTDTWKLKGTYNEEKFSGDEAKNIYYVSGGAIRNAQKVSIAPYRAYFTGPSIETLTGGDSTPNGARVRIVIDSEENEAAALQLVMDDVLPAHLSGKAYTLFGTEAGESYRGIVIRGARKSIASHR